MSESSSQMAGHPHGGRDDPDTSGPLPGEQPEAENQSTPVSADRNDETGSRAAQGGPMAGGSEAPLQASEGIPEQVDAPSPADATDASVTQPPGGSAANQSGRTPDTP